MNIHTKLSLLHTLATVLMVCFLCSAIITLAAIAYGSPILIAGFALMFLTGIPFKLKEERVTEIETLKWEEQRKAIYNTYNK